MIDYILAFADEPTAQADRVAGAYWIAASAMSAAQWRGDVCIAGVEVWNSGQDTISQSVDSDGNPLNVVTHAYFSGFWLVISRPARDAAIEVNPALVLGADRDLANSGAPPSQFLIALGPGQTLSGFAGANISPEFAGANYPFGAAA